MIRSRTTLAALLFALCAPAAAQDRPGYLALPDGHWSLEAVRRAEALGLVGGYLPAQRTAARQEVGRALDEAARRAAGTPQAALADGWRARFLEEFPIDHAGSALEGSARRWTGRAAPGSGYSPTQGRPPVGARALPDLETLSAALDAAGSTGEGLAGRARVTVDEDGFDVSRWEVSVASRTLALSLGRGGTGYGFGPGGGVTLSGLTALRRVQLQTVQPIRLPAGLGFAALHAQAARLDGSRHPGDPVFTSVAVTLRPTPRLTLAGYRGAIFGGDSAGSDLTAKTFFQTLLGLTQNLENGFANQVASLDVRYRLPTERVLPVTLYTEWGMEDLDVIRAVRDSPGGLAGIYLPRLPGLTALAGGVERVSFSRSCCGNGIWYRHFQHHGGWAAGSQPLGHPLGGHGRENAAYLSTALADARVRAELRGFRRFRGSENLYAPERGGRSRGVAGQAGWRPAPHAELWVRGSYEEGEDWLERSLAAGVSFPF